MQASGRGQLGLQGLAQCATVFGALPLHDTDDATQQLAQLLDSVAHAPELLGVRVVARLGVGRLADTRVALAKRNTVGPRGLQEVFAPG